MDELCANGDRRSENTRKSRLAKPLNFFATPILKSIATCAASTIMEHDVRGPLRAAVLAYNLLILWENLQNRPTPTEPTQIPEEVPP